MQIADVKGETRNPGNRRANRKLRTGGLVPAVIYGHGKDPETVALSQHDLELALHRLQHVLNVQVGGKKGQYLVKEVQYDHLQMHPIHVDLMRVDPNERVQVKVPIELRGEPHGIHEGGELVHVITDLDVECRLLEIPEFVRPVVDHMGVGDTLHIKDLELPEGVTATGNGDDVVVVVRAKRGVTVDELEQAAEPTAEAGGKEPEVFGRTAKDESEGKSGD